MHTQTFLKSQKIKHLYSYPMELINLPTQPLFLSVFPSHKIQLLFNDGEDLIYTLKRFP